MRRIALAFRSFFGILFGNGLSDEVITELGLSRRVTPPPMVARVASLSDGALQILAILQRDSRLVDFIMEDVSAYSDDQIGAAVRGLHDQCRESLGRYVKLQPIIDGVEGTFTKPASMDPVSVKLLGNVPAQPPTGGVLRHKGWRAATIELPPMGPKQDASIIAPAELEIE